MEEPYCKRDGTYWRSYYQKEKNDANAKKSASLIWVNAIWTDYITA